MRPVLTRESESRHHQEISMTLTLDTPTLVDLDMPPDATFDQWALAGRLLTAHHSGLHWLIGDWVAYGAERWEDRWLQVAASVGIPHSTLAQAAAVAVAFPAERRRARLSWSHHRAVLNVDDADDWLDRAEAERWSARTLTEKVRESRELNAGQGELENMPPKPMFDRSTAARLLADGVRWVRVDLVTGEMEAAS